MKLPSIKLHIGGSHMPLLQDNLIAVEEDIRQIYCIILGRKAENTQVITERKYGILKNIIADFLHSEEFAAITAETILSGQLKHRQLSTKDLISSNQWVSKITSQFIPVRSSWWVSLHTLLLAAQAVDILASNGQDEFFQLVANRADAEGQQLNTLLPLLNIDDNWISKQYLTSSLALPAEAHLSQDHSFLTEVVKKNWPILPYFSENLSTVYEPLRSSNNVTTSDIIEQTLEALQRGITSHWLFSADFYTNFLSWKNDESRDGKKVSHDDCYSDFLIHGSSRNYGPHPLFCSYAYWNSLGKSLDSSESTAFFDYASRGCFEDFTTSAIFDGAYYLAMNPSIKISILSGRYINSLHHFVTKGIYENLPFSPDFDISFYISRYPEVADAVRRGDTPSVTWHYIYNGILEGRSPNPYFNTEYYRRRYPLIGEEMKRLNIRTEHEHFLLIGRNRGYKPELPLVSTRPAMDAAKAVFQRRARRSLGNSRRRPLRFRIAESDTPVLSVILPVYNEVEFTSLFMECAYFAADYLFHALGRHCEIIVVNNGSSDGTDAFLKTCEGVVVRTFEGPIGFPRAVNAGAMIARGEIVIVANNDIHFTPDVFVRMVERLTAEPRIGVLGGLTILPNETLQEAGSFLNTLAGVEGLGRNENPWDAYFQGLHRADYCTGSFIGFRRSEFEKLGGLDEAFSPGYYEETDFTFRMFETLGKVAVVDDAIQVTHFEHASFGKGRPPTTAYALIKNNQGRFAFRHRNELTKRPSPALLASPEGVRPGAAGRVRMLVIEDLMPDPRLGSGFVRTFQLLSELSREGIAFDLLILNSSAVVDDYSDPLVTVYRAWLPGEDIDTMLGHKLARYSHVLVCRTHNLADLAPRLEAARARFNIEVICDTEALTSLRLLEMKRVIGTSISEQQIRDAVRMELDAPVHVSHWIAVNAYERDRIEEAGFGPVSVICQSFPDPQESQIGWDERFRILAIGAVHESGAPNHDALLWFLDNIWTRIPDIMNRFTLTIVGFWKADVLDSFKARYDGYPIEYLHTVSADKLHSLYAESRLAIAPTRFAAGVACKVLEAMVAGVPIVITDLLETQVVGADAERPTGLATGSRFDGGESFAEWMRLLSTDQELWDRVQRRQYEAAEPLAGSSAFDAGVSSMTRGVGLRGSKDRNWEG